ncbi:putative 5'-nucleotidase [Mycobacteroides abscessus subsp. abscessus]|nr:putative 5'-nucleotidase [Mycobacteroides abscessus subsp. abscessus]
MIKHALSQLDDVPPTGVVMVGDRVHDVEGAAAQAEWVIGRVSTPEQLLEELDV